MGRGSARRRLHVGSLASVAATLTTAALTSAVALAVGACGGSARAAEAPRRSPPPPLRSFLTTQPDWMLEVAAKALWETPEARRALQGSIGDADLVDFRSRTGVDVRHVEDGLAAGYGNSSMWIARGGQDPREVRRLLRQRLRPVHFDDRRRGLSGMLGEAPVGLRRLGKLVIAYGDGPGAEVGALRARSGPGQQASSLATRLGDAPLRFVYMGPLELPEETGAGLLLSRIERSGFSVAPRRGRLEVRILLVGELPSTASDNLRSLLLSIGGSPLGRAFGADEAARRAGITVNPGGAELVLDFDPAVVDAGVRMLFVDDLRALFGST